MVTPAVAPYVPAYASYTPYITGQDFLNEPTGVDVSQLIPAGSSLDEAAALARLVANASSEADRICQKILAATLDVASGSYRIRPDGTIRIPVDYVPLIQVNAVSVGYAPSGLQALTDLSGLWLEKKTAWVPVWGTGLQQPNMTPPAPAYPGANRMFAVMKYVNGWAHTTLSAPAALGASQITPVTTLGLVPGLPVTLYDGQNTEANAVSPSYVVGSATVPLASPLVYAHAAGVTVSALPPFVRQAVVRLGAWLVKTRGSEAVVLDSFGQPSRTQSIDAGGDPDYMEAERALKPLKRSR